MLLEMNREKGT